MVHGHKTWCSYFCSASEAKDALRKCHLNGGGLRISKEMNLKRGARVGLVSMVIMHGAVTI